MSAPDTKIGTLAPWAESAGDDVAAGQTFGDDLFRVHFDELPQPAYIWQRDGDDFRLSGHNRAAARLPYSNIGALMGSKATDLQAEGRDLVSDLRETTRSGNVIRREVDHRYSGGGVLRRLAVTIVPLSRDLAVMHTEDITERTRAETALRDSEARFRNIIENALVGVWIIDGDSTTTYVNERAAQMLGYTVGEIVGRSLYEFMHESDLDAAWELRKRRRSGLQEQFDFRMLHKSGSDVWVAVVSKPIDVGGEPNAGVLSMFSDITSRKEAEQALKASEARLRGLLDSHPDTIIRMSRDGTYLDLHPTGYALSALPLAPKEMIGRNVAELFDETFASRHRALRDRAFETGETQIWRMAREFNGLLRHVEARISKSGDDEVVVTVRDTTEAELTERQLQESEARLNAAQRVAKIGCWERVFPYDRAWWSEETYKIYEMDPAEYPEPSIDDMLARVHPEDIETVRAQFKKTLTAGGRFSSDVRLLLPSGVEKFIHSEGALISDGEGRPIKLIGTTQEITERKLAERKARQLAARLEALTEAAFDGVFVSENGIMTDVSDRFAATLGYTASELVGAPTSKVLARPSLAAPVGDRAEHTERTERAERAERADGESPPRLVFAVRKDGSELPIEISAAELADGDRQIHVSAIRDVTDRARLEREIVDVGEQERRRIGRDLHDGLGQMLTGISLSLSSLAQKLGRLAPSLAPEAHELTRHVQSTIADAKHMAKQLSPNVVRDGGLVYALQRLAAEVDEHSDVRCTATIAAECDIDDETAATHVYRIAQEALNNALIHSRASHIELWCGSRGSMLELEIKDDGIGIAPLRSRVEGSGIRNMRYRAHSLGGTLEIARRQGGGTVVSCKYLRDSPTKAERTR